MATKTWAGTGGINLNWSSSGNWAPAGVPAAGDDVVFNTGANNCVVDGNTNSLRTLNMASGWTGILSGSGTYTISINGDDSAYTECRLDTHGDHTFAGYIIIAYSGRTFHIYPPEVPTVFSFKHFSTTSAAIYYMRPLIQKNGSYGLYYNYATPLHMDGLTDDAGFTHTITHGYFNDVGVIFGKSNYIFADSIADNAEFYTRQLSAIPAHTPPNVTYTGLTTTTKTVGVGTGFVINNLVYWANGLNNTGLLDFTVGNTQYFTRIAMDTTHKGIKSLRFQASKNYYFSNAASGFENETNRTTLYTSSAGTTTTLTNSNASVVNKCDWLNLKDITFTGLWEIGDNNIVQTKVTGCRVKASGMRFGE